MDLGLGLDQATAVTEGRGRARGSVDLEEGPEDEGAAQEQERGGDDLNDQHGSLSSGPTLRHGTVRAGPEFRSIFALEQANFRRTFAMAETMGRLSSQPALVQ